MPLKRKIELIDAVEKHPAGEKKKRPAGKKKKEIVEEFGIVPNTLSTIVKDKEKYRQTLFGGQINISKQRQRAPTHDDIDEALLCWVSPARSENVPISGPILSAKADSLAEVIVHLHVLFNISCVNVFGAPHIEPILEILDK